MHSEITALLAQLRLFGMSNSIESILKKADKTAMATQDVILDLLKAEYQDKQTRALQNRINAAKLPEKWTLDTFPFQEQPGVNKLQIMNLAKLNFMERHENIIFIGNTGTGKTGLSMGMLQQALLNGYRCRFYNTQEMLDELYASMADRTSARLLKKLFNYDLVCIDELGYQNLNTEQENMFFKLIEMRYNKKSTIITTNLSFDEWYGLFKKKELVDAMLDRFKHHCNVINIKGPSLRAPENKKK